VLLARSSFAEGGVTTYSRKILGIEAHDQLLVYVLLIAVLVIGGVAVARGVVKVSPAVLATTLLVPGRGADQRPAGQLVVAAPGVRPRAGPGRAGLGRGQVDLARR
jgi:hypothetical protein